MEAKGGASGDERGGVGSPALDSSDAFSLFHEFINTFETVWTRGMLNTSRCWTT